MYMTYTDIVVHVCMCVPDVAFGTELRVTLSGTRSEYKRKCQEEAIK